MSTFSLQDDGTMDTVLGCDDCGAKLRYQFSNSEWDVDASYDDFLEWAKEDAAENHSCEDERCDWCIEHGVVECRHMGM